MRLISLNVLKQGMVLGRTIYNEAGHPLLQKGVLISERIIQRLTELNVQYLYIDDKLSQGIEITETVPLTVRNEAVESVKKSFKTLKGLKTSEASFMLDKQSKSITTIVEQLLDIIMNSKEMLTILTDAFLFDEYLYQHSFQVTLYSIAIAKELGYSSHDLRLIGIGAILHDVGKIQIPQSILSKPGRLTNEEFEEMKLHTRYGFDMLRNLHSISLLVAHCAFQHHERLDGSGYPRGIVDFEIHPFAKIIGVADVFDAVTSNRVYRNKMLPTQGISILEAGSGTIYDSKVVDALKRTVVHYPNGIIVSLKDGRRGVVARQNLKDAARPIIRIFEENGSIIGSTYELNLLENPQYSIDQIEVNYAKDLE